MSQPCLILFKYHSRNFLVLLVALLERFNFSVMYCIPKLIAPPGGKVSCSSENRFGSKCSFTCRNGYNIAGSGQRQCEAAEGEPPAYWTGNDTYCESKLLVYLLRKHQSINQSIDRSIKRPNDETMKRSTHQSINPSIVYLISRSISYSVIELVYQPANQATSQPDR